MSTLPDNRIAYFAEISLAARGAFKAAGLRTLDDLTPEWTDEKLLALRNVAQKSVDRLRARQKAYNEARGLLTGSGEPPHAVGSFSPASADDKDGVTYFEIPAGVKIVGASIDVPSLPPITLPPVTLVQLPDYELLREEAFEILKIMAQRDGYKLSADFVAQAWKLADAHQAEYEKRVNQGASTDV